MYVFGKFELNERALELRCAGELVKIEPKVFSLLAYLIRHRDRAVSRDELLEQLWPGEFVTESALTYCVKAVRRAVGDDGVAQRIIRTAHRHGYRFVAAVEERSGQIQDRSDDRHTAVRHPERKIWVGREPEMRELGAVLDEACAGHGRLAVLMGEPGIGKTRTTEEVAATALTRGAQVLVGRCHEGGGAPVFWPWMQIIRSYTHDRSAADLRTAMGRSAADIAAIVPEVRERLSDLPPPTPIGGEQARFRLFDGIVTFFKNAARVQPLVLVVDDLHWADEPSLLLLQFFARELCDASILLLGTCRNLDLGRDHPVTRTLGDLVRIDGSRHIRLVGLSESEIASFIAETAGSPPPPSLAHAVHQETDGNPFFVTEVVRLLQNDGRLQHAQQTAAWILTMPETVRDAIGRRLDQLSPDCSRLLSLAAVVGREFDVNLLVRATPGRRTAHRGREPGQAAVLVQLDEAARARVIEALAEPPGTYRFSHALIREALYEGLSISERVRAHAAIGATLEQIYQTNPEPHLAELAHHFSQASPAGHASKAFDYACRAADRARRLLAYEEAAAGYERALQLVPVVAADATRHCEVLLALGEMRWRGGDMSGAKHAFHEAAAVARQHDAAELFARAALGFGGGFRGFDVGLIEQPLIDLLEEARQRCGATDSALHASVLARLAVALYHVPESLERRVSLSQQAVDMARRVGDVEAHLGALYSRHWAIWGPDNLQDRLVAATDMVGLSAAANDREMALHAHRFRLIDRLELGDIAGVDADLESCGRLADELRQPYYQWYVGSFRAMRALLDGHFAECERLALLACSIGERAASQNVSQTLGVQMMFLRREQGRLEEIVPGLQRFVEQYPRLPSWRCGLVYALSEVGRPAETRAQFEILAADDFNGIPRNTYWLTAITLLSEACAFLGDARRAAVLYQLLLPFKSRNVEITLGVACVGSASRSLARLATTLGRWNEAIRHFGDALRMNEKLGAPHLSAHTQREYAEMLLARGQAGDAVRAGTLLTQASSIYQRLGMTSFVEKVSACRRRTQETALPQKRRRAPIAQSYSR